MAIDILQEKIRKSKCPIIVNLTVRPELVPSSILSAEPDPVNACFLYASQLLTALKGIVPAVRFSMSQYTLMGSEGIEKLSELTMLASEMGFYVVMDAPAMLTPGEAEVAAKALFGDDSRFRCDSAILLPYLGSDLIRPFVPYCTEGPKSIFSAVRTPNKSSAELQDLLTGSRLVHIAAADHVNRYGGETVGRYGYSGIGVLSSATSAQSLQSLRSKYPRLFIIADGLDVSGANAKNCAQAFDRMGHGAIVGVGESVTGAWRQAEGSQTDYTVAAVSSVQRASKAVSRYITIL